MGSLVGVGVDEGARVGVGVLVGVDEVAHRFGAGSGQLRAAVADLDGQLERMRDRLDGSARMVLSADHGFLDVPREARHLIRASDPLLNALRFPPTGDARVLFLHLGDGKRQRVEEYFRERFGEEFLLIPVDEAEGAGLFGPGPLSPVVRQRMGDLVAISTGHHVIEYRPIGGKVRMAYAASHHSGLTPAEMRVPLVVA